jgi:ATP-dependent Lhr-like helicase
VERGGRGILRLQETEGPALVDAVSRLVESSQEGVIPKLAIERLDGEPVIGSPFEEVLLEAGFNRQPRRLVA